MEGGFRPARPNWHAETAGAPEARVSGALRADAHPIGLGFRQRLPYICAMLRIRPKPPAGLPTISAGEPWSGMDIADLEYLLGERWSIPEIAEFLCRDVDEIEAKIAEVRRH